RRDRDRFQWSDQRRELLLVLLDVARITAVDGHEAVYFPALKQILALLDGLGDPLRVGEVARCVLRVREGFEPLLHLFGSAEETEVPSAVGDHGAPGLAFTLRLAEVAEGHHPAAGPDFAAVQAIELVV